MVPVCGVRAGIEESWRVRKPVVLPFNNVTHAVKLAEVEYVPDLKRPVSDLVVSSKPMIELAELGTSEHSDQKNTLLIEPTEVVSTDGKHSAVKSSTEIESENTIVSQAESSSSQLYPSGKRPDLKKNKPADKDEVVILPSDGVRKEFASVSLVPSDNDEMRRWKSSENGLFFTTPKRFLGLAKKFVRAIPTISVRETYDSNIDYTDIDDMVTEITPSLKVDIIGEKVNLKFDGDFIYRDYFENSKFDRYDYNVNIAGKYKFSPTLDAGLSVAHKRYHNLDQNTYESGGVEIDPTIVLKTTATPEVNWRFSENDNLRVSNYVDKTDYERKADSDYITNVLSLVWGHLLNDGLSQIFVGEMNTFTHFSREIDDLKSDQLTFQGVIGFDHQFSPGWKMSIKGGPGITFSNYSNDEVTGDNQDYIYQLRAEIGYRQLEYAIVPAIERSVRPGRYGENEIMDQAEIYARYDFSEFLKYDTINTYWMNESDGTSGGEKHKASGIFTQQVLRWEFEKDWKVFTGFSYNWGRNELSGTVNERVKTWIGASFSFPTEIK
ncbi:hypothetical protein [Maridesulfovibrio zosterae]|uniref:hypothetical protein n=1 Tax=Maridesulfovibrio zosterae TaxID=82171 RepID=UPI00040197B3|nr:hypothetical protein [Maridesulfovibrio zosterae]